MANPIFQAIRDTIRGETVQLNLNGNAVMEAAPSSVDLISLDIGTIDPVPAPAIVQKVAPPTIEPSGIAVMDLGGGTTYSNLLRKGNVNLYRRYAKYSTWVRAAIDYHRRMLGRAAWEIVRIDETARPRRLDKNVKAAVEDLLRHPNAAEESYGHLKELLVEDYLVVGHGCLELDLNRDLTPRAMLGIDAATIGFIKDWDGTDRKRPRYVEFTSSNGNTVKRYLAHEQIFCLVNRPMTDTKVGFSHVEALHRTVVALLSGDEYMIRQILQPATSALINLGEGVTKQQVDDFRQQMRQVQDALAIVGGSKSAQVLRLTASAEEMKILDGQEWYVRQVAAIFGMSTVKLKLAVDTSRANTEAMMTDDLEAITGELTRIQELETSTFINRYSYLGDINLKFSYPIMHRQDEMQQARIARLQSGNNFTSINEARSRTGEKQFEQTQFKYADEPILNTKDGPLPLSVWEKKIAEYEANIGKEPNTPDTPPPEAENAQQ